jgi:hypothetical protein
MAPTPAKERDRTISMAAEEEIMSVLRERIKEITNKTPLEKQEVGNLSAVSISPVVPLSTASIIKSLITTSNRSAGVC